MVTIKYFREMSVFTAGFMVGGLSALWIHNIRLNDNQAGLVSRNLNMVNQWLILRMAGIDIASVLKNRSINCIAIYGMGIYGRHLVRELCNTDIKIVYGMDQKKMQPYMDVNIVKVKAGLPEVDLVVNSVINSHDEICRELKQYFGCPIVSLEDLVFESYQVEKGC